MESIIYDVSFWLVVNFLLIVAVLGLVLIRQQLTKPVAHAAAVIQQKKLDEELALYKSMIDEGNGKEAVKTVFRSVWKKICRLYAVDERGLTVVEVMSSGKLPEKIREKILLLYRIYEPVKFGDVEPSREQLMVFDKTLEQLSEDF
uniref:DUF4129 domain-containing protein n=1 Tax=Caldiarchaeum subterraneum TaxID=311458 RepID=A0A7C5U5L4_CALS0